MSKEEFLRMPISAVLKALGAIVGALVAYIFISLADEVGYNGNRLDKLESDQAVIRNDVDRINKKVDL